MAVGSCGSCSSQSAVQVYAQRLKQSEQQAVKPFDPADLSKQKTSPVTASDFVPDPSKTLDIKL